MKSPNLDIALGDFCLSSDRQTNGTAFCSSACHLEQLNYFALAKPTASTPYNRHITRAEKTNCGLWTDALKLEASPQRLHRCGTGLDAICRFYLGS